MDSRFKTSNIIALLIAVALIASGFALLFIHEQSETAKKQAPVSNPSTMKVNPTTEASLTLLLASGRLTNEQLTPRNASANVITSV